MDGIDAAMLRTDGENHVEFGPTAFFSYPAAFRREIEEGLEAARRSCAGKTAGPPCTAGTAISVRHAEAVRSLLDQTLAEWRHPDIVGFHGQTVLHRPQNGVTVQLGDGPLLARATGIPVVYDMRAKDMKKADKARRWCLPTMPRWRVRYRGAGLVCPHRLCQYRRHLQHHLCWRRRSDRLRHRTGQCADRSVGSARRRRAV